MGELGVECSNAAAERRQDFGLGWKSSPPPDPASLAAAEAATQLLLSCIHPTLDAEEDRRDIIDYVVRLIKSHIHCEVFPYGSVPLKTYLPDGDIDFTVINADDSFAHDVVSLLKMEEQNLISEFKVKDTQFIDAEVKIVKCLVRDTVIDISFNQLGGLSTLCFLEQVDRLVGRNHLFKRSIILIKAWCYYESRILGAHHGLISTYALETLVLYIFQLFHSSLGGPLSVLYRFLEYYSQFDWENYCISLKGPVCKASLPDIVVKLPENGWHLMFNEDFLENCVEMFSSSSSVLEGRPRAFQLKNLNIIDPLKENNNLGRSVRIGNFHRIRSAFKYGACKLDRVLSLPCDKIPCEMHRFFSNAVARHGHDITNSIHHLALKLGDKKSFTASMSLPVNIISGDSMLLKSSVNDNDGVELESKNQNELPLKTGSEGWYTARTDSGHLTAVETFDAIASSSKSRVSSLYHVPHSYYDTPISWNNYDQSFCFSKLSTENGSLEKGKFLKTDLVDSASQNYDFNSWLLDSKEHWEMNYRYQRHVGSTLTIYTDNLGSVTKAYNVDDIPLDSKDLELTGMGNSEAFNPLADLTGDYHGHIRSLLYGQLFNGLSLSAVAHFRPLWWLPWTMQPVSCEQNNYRAAYSAPPPYGYLPHANGSLGERHSKTRSSKKISDCLDRFNRHEQSNGSYTASGARTKENDSHEVMPEKGGSQHERRVDAKHLSPCSVGNENDRGGNSSGTWKIEFGSIGNLAEEVLLAEKQSKTAVMKQDRFVEGEAIHLKSEAEFPPLGL